jgi:hypothetical protein
MRGRRRVILAVVAVAAVALAAFLLLRGGDDDSGPEATPQQVVARLDEICARLARQNDKLEPPFRPYDTHSAPFFAAVHDNVDAARAALAELRPPASDREAVDRIVDGYDAVDVRLDAVEAAVAVEQDGEAVAQILAIGDETADIAVGERMLGVCRGDTSARSSVFGVLRRTRDNPLTETGPLIP